MTTLIISSIIALLVIAGAALAIARWLHHCEEYEQIARDVAKSSADVAKTLEEVAKSSALFIQRMKETKDLVAMEKLLNDAKDIINGK